MKTEDQLFFCGMPDPLAAAQELTNRVDASSADPVMTVVR